MMLYEKQTREEAAAASAVPPSLAPKAQVIQVRPYRGTWSLRTRLPDGPYRRPVLRVLGGS